MSISGTIAIGNGEKCPYCELIIEENMDTIKHLMDKHPVELVQALFNKAYSFGEEK